MQTEQTPSRRSISMATLHHSDEEQAAILRDIARNGATGVYGYGNGESMPHNYQDLDDPSALLGSIAYYEHPENDTSHDHFASLLQAATTATEAENAQIGHGHNGGSRTQSMISDQFGFPNLSTGAKRKRGGDEYPRFIKTKIPKKKSLNNEEEELKTREIWGPEEEEEEEDELMETEFQQSPAITANARAAGVHSAAALFRRPSSASKKYTSKLGCPLSVII